MIDPDITRELAEQRKVILGLVIDFQISNPKIVKRSKEVAVQCVLKGNSISDRMIEQAIHVVAVRSARSCSHPENEARCKIVKNFTIT